MSAFGSRTGMGTKVILNVYDLGPTNEYLYPWGLGTYHSGKSFMLSFLSSPSFHTKNTLQGVHVFGQEYTFASGSGVFTHEVICANLFITSTYIYVFDDSQRKYLDRQVFERVLSWVCFVEQEASLTALLMI
jgi:hypothetical protein